MYPELYGDIVIRSFRAVDAVNARQRKFQGIDILARPDMTILAHHEMEEMRFLVKTRIRCISIATTLRTTIPITAVAQLYPAFGQSQGLHER